MTNTALNHDPLDELLLVAPAAPDRLPAMLFLAALLHGIESKIEPGPASDSAVNERDESLPLSLPDALAATLESTTLQGALGEPFVDLYCRHRAAEWRAFLDVVGPREYDWYL